MEDWKIKGSVVRVIGILIILSLIVSQIWSIYEIKRLRNDLDTAQVISSVVTKVNDHDEKIAQIIEVLVKVFHTFQPNGSSQLVHSRIETNTLEIKVNTAERTTMGFH